MAWADEVESKRVQQDTPGGRRDVSAKSNIADSMKAWWASQDTVTKWVVRYFGILLVISLVAATVPIPKGEPKPPKPQSEPARRLTDTQVREKWDRLRGDASRSLDTVSSQIVDYWESAKLKIKREIVESQPQEGGQ